MCVSVCQSARPREKALDLESHVSSFRLFYGGRHPPPPPPPPPRINTRSNRNTDTHQLHWSAARSRWAAGARCLSALWADLWVTSSGSSRPPSYNFPQRHGVLKVCENTPDERQTVRQILMWKLRLKNMEAWNTTSQVLRQDEFKPQFKRF